MDSIRFNGLIKRARQAQKKAYAPYSKYRVGAAVLAGSGKVYTGANVENVSYGLTICAERSAIFKAINEGEKVIDAIAVAAGQASPKYPCGACLQVISEFISSPESAVILAARTGSATVRRFQELVPYPCKIEGLKK